MGTHAMDELWNYYFDNFKNILHLIPFHENIVALFEKPMSSYSNIILYSNRGFPLEILYYTGFRKKFGNFKVNRHIWNKEVIYSETPYYFEIDLSIPQQPKDLVKFTEFIKHIVSNPSINSDRHVIIIRHIDYIVNNDKFYDFRVLFERYSKNALFICTTYYLTKLEPPIRSRFHCIRVPLLTVGEMQSTFQALDLTYHPFLEKTNCQDVFFAIYVHYLSKNIPGAITEEFCSYKCPAIYEFMKSNPKPSMENIREITHKISINDISISDMTADLLRLTPAKHKIALVRKAAEIDHLLSRTEGFRKPLYIEYLFHAAIYGAKIT